MAFAEPNPEEVPHGGIVLLSLGNDVLGDDAVGLAAGREVAALGIPGVRVLEAPTGGLNLLDDLEGARRALILDSLATDAHPPGTLLELDAAALPLTTASSPHYVGLPDILALAQRLGIAMPLEVRILAVTIDPVFEVADDLNPEVGDAVYSMAARAAEILSDWSEEEAAVRRPAAAR